MRLLPCQDAGQSCGYYPDSSATSLDKQNVRDGHCAIWGPLQRMRALAEQSGSAPFDPGRDYGAEMLEFWLEHRLAVVDLLDRAQGSAYEHCGERFVALLLKSTLEQIQGAGPHVPITPRSDRSERSEAARRTEVMLCTRSTISSASYCCVAIVRGPMKRLRRLKRKLDVCGTVSRSFFRFLVIVIMNRAELPWLPINTHQAKKNDHSLNQRCPYRSTIWRSLRRQFWYHFSIVTA